LIIDVSVAAIIRERILLTWFHDCLSFRGDILTSDC